MRRPGKPILLAAVTAALLLAGGVIWLFLNRTPPVPPHPLSLVAPASVVSVTAGDLALARNSAAFREAAALPTRLAAIRPGDARPINWAMARPVRIATSAGLVIWLQRAEHAGATWVRVNADPLPAADETTRRQAAAIKRLRFLAYRLGGPPAGRHG